MKPAGQDDQPDISDKLAGQIPKIYLTLDVLSRILNVMKTIQFRDYRILLGEFAYLGYLAAMAFMPIAAVLLLCSYVAAFIEPFAVFVK